MQAGGPLRRALCVAVMLLLLPAWPAFGEPGGPAEYREGGRAPSDVIWGPDLRLTQNSSDDTFPSLTADSSGRTHLFWERRWFDRMYLRLEDNGSVLGPERFIVSEWPTYQHSWQRTQNIGIDDELGVHASWTTQGIFGPMYQRFLTNGTPLCQPINLAPAAQMPHAVSLAVGNRRAYVTYEDELEDRIEMAFVTNNSAEYWLHSGYLAGKWGNGTTIGLDAGGNPYVFFKNATQSGLWFTWFDPYGNILMSSVFVGTHVAGFGPYSALPGLAFGADGAIHLLQASRVEGTRSLYYTKTDKYGMLLTGDIQITDSAADFGDICVDGNGNVHIVYCNSNDSEIYYVKIAPGKENDILVPVRLTNASGASRDPTIAARPNGGLALAWVDERDGNSEIYFKAGFHVGMELGMDPESHYQMTPIHLDQTIQFPMSVRNLGLLADTAMLGVNSTFGGMDGGIGKDYNGSGWKAWLDNGSISLGPREEKNFSVHLRGPASGLQGSYITIKVTAASGSYPMTQSQISFRVFLSLTRRIELGCQDGIHETPPESPASYCITVLSWDYAEEVNLTCFGPPGWNCLLNNNRVLLEPWETTTVNLTVVPAADASANETGTVSVTGVSTGDSSVKDTLFVRTRVAPVLKISIVADRSEDAVLPGEAADFSLAVEKTGNVANLTDVTLDVGTSSAGWNVTLSRYSLQLHQPEITYVALRVEAPASALLGDRLEVTVEVRDREQNLLACCTTTTTVTRVRDLVLYATEVPLKAYPGERVSLPVSVANRGNGEERLFATPPVQPAGWLVCFERPDGIFVTPEVPFTVEAGENASLKLVVIPSKDTTIGAYFVTGTLTDYYGNGYDVTAWVDVLQVFDLAVMADNPEAVVAPGEQARFELTIRNRGNGPEMVQFTGAGLPAGWGAPVFQPDEATVSKWLRVGPFGSGRMIVKVAVPANYTGGSVDFSVGAASLHNFTGAVTLYIRIMRVNIELSNITFEPANPSPGRLVHIRLLVSNTGDVNIENVVISVRDGNRTLQLRDLGRLPSGLSWLYVYDWVAVEGTHLLRFLADPANATAEHNELDNMVEVTIKVRAERAAGAPAWQGAVAATAVAIVVVLAGWLALKRRHTTAGRGR